MHRRQEFLEWLREIEKKWQKYWNENRVFEADPDTSKPKYFITVPYPYANGPLHIGHGRTYTIGDIIARYKRLRGYNVLYPMAFHITGTPIIAFSDMISRGDQRTINLYREYVKLYIENDDEVEKTIESFKDPLNLATFFAERIQRDFEELGFSIDWRRKFHTGEPIYNKFIVWQYQKLNEKGLITRGDHIVTFCLLHNQPEGEDDIQDADVNPVEIIEYTAIKFKLVDSDIYLLASTLRPETLLGATNLWVHPDSEYSILEWNGERVIVSKQSVVKLIHQHPGEDIREIDTVKGESLIGKQALSPLGDQLLILPAWFIDPDNATGVVYSEPSDAPYDYVALMELKNNPELLKRYNLDPELVSRIEPKKIIEIPGVIGHHAKNAVESAGISSQLDTRLEEVTREVYKEQFYNGYLIIDDPEFKGLKVPEAREKMKNKLLAENKAVVFYELNRKARCRAGGDIIVAKITGQWFINYNIQWLKNKAKELIEKNKIMIIPEKYRKLFIDTIDWLDKRPCARKRGIGTRLPWSPDWIIESLSDSTIYMAFYTIAHIIREHGIRPEQLESEVFEYVFLGYGDPREISARTGIDLSLLEKMRREFTYWYPVDHRHTAIPHITNHLTFYILHHLAIFPEQYAPVLITLNETVIREGAKMSKSKGNVIPLRHITTMYSADLFRLYISWGASLDSILDWREADVDKVVANLAKFVNIAKNASMVSCHEDHRDIYSEWFRSRFYEILGRATRSIESLEIRDYVQAVFFDVLSLIDQYRDMVGDRYLCAVREILGDWIIALSPVIPHLAEEINTWIGREPSVTRYQWPTIQSINEELIALVESIELIINDIKELIQLLRRHPRKAYIIIAPEWKREIARMIIDNVPLKQVLETMRTKYGLRGREYEIVDTYNSIKEMNKTLVEKIVKTTSKSEHETYVKMIDYLKARIPEIKEFIVLWEDEARAQRIPKAERALPLRPGIYID